MCDHCRATSYLSHPITGCTPTRLTGAGQSPFCSLAVTVSHVAREHWLEVFWIILIGSRYRSAHWDLWNRTVHWRIVSSSGLNEFHLNPFDFRVNIFYSNFFNQSVCTKLVRNERTLIFSRDDFDASWRSYKHGSSKMPSNEVYLGFARQWFFQGKSQLPITAVVKSRRYQSLVDTVSLSSLYCILYHIIS